MTSPDRSWIDLTPLLASSRAAMLSALAERFPRARRPDGDERRFPRGGREAALERLARLDPVAYAGSRNHVDGPVTRLSPWIRHGVLSLAEVRDRALTAAGSPKGAEKLISELAWRDYWRRVQEALGDRILEPIEPFPHRPAAFAPPNTAIPDDVLTGSTGLPCIDAFSRRLVSSGWLHNHERLWLAAWLVHVRGVDWRAGADWFLEHLLDGDPASNHLSWQWVAGTFSAKPYLARRATIEGCTDGRWCRGCPVYDSCPFESAAQSSPPADAGTERAPLRIPPAPPWHPSGPQPANASPARRPLVWLTLDSVAAESPAARRYPTAARLLVLDRSWIEDEQVSLARLAFVLECAAGIPNVSVEAGDPAEICPRVAAREGCDGVAAAESPCPRFRRAADRVGHGMAIEIHRWPRFVDPGAIRDLGRFSRYWKAVRDSALERTPAES